MMKRDNKRISIAAAVAAIALSGLILPACANKKSESFTQETEIAETETPSEANAETVAPNETHTTTLAEQPKTERAEYIRVTAEGVNIRTGAGSGYSSLGAAEKDTLYKLCGKSGSWYETRYKNKTAYISANYCKVVQMDRSADKAVESVIDEGCKCLGVTYVYGATRYHDGKGNKLKGFTASAFDCSSLMQYIFKLGAGVNLQVNTRTQIYQGETVKKSGLKRGDLMFFTNSSRKNNTGVERVGHVALYLGDNYILHTASDYAKIEQISSTRWGYYIQAQRVL
ncbi:MAG: NlpC/P60 family protein [Roseburia sp.]|nr:NlpC/P60 family protein [Roseburia sp.]